ncbi:MAG: hypothetical protein RIQ94_1714 [Pseudomonadota bacterium]|jgi:hypothetical protein
MSSNKDNLTPFEKDYLPTFDHCSDALHAQTRQAEQALQASKAQQDSQDNVKPEEAKK